MKFQTYVLMGVFIFISPLGLAEENTHDNSEQALIRLSKEKEKTLQQLQGLQKMLPMEIVADPSALIQSPNGENLPLNPSIIDQTKKFMASPKLKAFVLFMTDPSTLRNAMQIAEHPSRKGLIVYEIIWLVVMFILRSRILYSQLHWAKKTLLRFASSVLYIGVAFWVMPALIIGTPYTEFLTGLFNILKQ